MCVKWCFLCWQFMTSERNPLADLRSRPPTRSTPEKKRKGGAFPGAGRPEKENIDPNVNASRVAGGVESGKVRRRKRDLLAQQDKLVNPNGRSWLAEEVALIL